MGPMAQDLYSCYGLGASDTGIATIDGIGVSLAAAQALEARTRKLQQENVDLRERLEQLESIVHGLTQ